MHWANQLKKQRKRRAKNNYSIRDAKDWADYMAELNKQRIMRMYEKASPKFRMGRYKQDPWKNENNGDWNTTYENLNCCSKFILGYFWFLRWVKQTSKIKITDDKDFTFEDLGFPPTKVFKNSRAISRIIRSRGEGSYQLDHLIDEQDCIRLRQTLGKINREQFLRKYPEVLSMVHELISFWDNQPDCDYIYLMNALNMQKSFWFDREETERKQFQTNTPAATQAELITDKDGQDEWKMI
tara:strand:- start:101 stop:820 length:720 start_codon:yes stop_codon:yes gene_type:complete